MFSNELQYYPFTVNNARNLVITSSFLHKTASHLDLQICLPVPNPAFSLVQVIRRYIALDGGYFLNKSFFRTEESFQNHLLPKRRLLYSLNLDFSKERECNNSRNEYVPDSLPLDGNCLFVDVIGVDTFFKFVINSLIEPAFKKTNDKLRLLRWMVNFRFIDSTFISPDFQSSFAKTLYDECVDSEFAMRCFGRLMELRNFLITEDITCLEYFLHHARICDFDVRSQKGCLSSLTDFCIQELSFKLVHSFLKYEDTVYYTENSFETYWKYISKGFRLTENEIRRHENLNQWNKLRLYRILQIFWNFLLFNFQNNELLNNELCSVVLCLVWRSIPDSYVSLQEMRDSYGHVLPIDINLVHSFYEEAIGETVSCQEPRRLTHYCRSVVRRSLCNSKQWLPDGIKQLPLPPRFQSFLNLERDNLKPENFHSLEN